MTSQEYGKRTIDIRNRFERYITALMKRYFSMQMADVRSNMERGQDPFQNWEKWDRIISDWVEPKVRVAIKAIHQNTIDYMGVESNSNDVTVVFKAGEVMRRLDNVNDTTRERIKAVIEAQKSKRAVSDAIDEVMLIFQRFIASRSPVIGLTLATASAGQGVDMALKDNYKDVKKRWRAFIDEDTRDAHEEADGQTVGEHENFIVGGESLRWPGDPYASAGNIINCRCYVEPVLE